MTFLGLIIVIVTNLLLQKKLKSPLIYSQVHSGDFYVIYNVNHFIYNKF